MAWALSSMVAGRGGGTPNEGRHVGVAAKDLIGLEGRRGLSAGCRAYRRRCGRGLTARVPSADVISMRGRWLCAGCMRRSVWGVIAYPSA